MDTHTFDGVIAEFITSLGVNPVAYLGSNVISLSLENSGQYFVEHCDGGVIVYLVRQYQELSSGTLIALLQACDHRSSGQNCIYAGLCEENKLMYIVYIKQKNVTVQSLFGELNRLSDMHDAIQVGAHA